MAASIDEINAFLESARAYKAQNKLDFIKGSKEKYTLGELGISFRDAYEMLNLLTYQNYCQGPEQDHLKAYECVWVFGLPEEPEDIYVKLKFRTDKDDLLFISFHFAEYPMRYPYRPTPSQESKSTT